MDTAKVLPKGQITIPKRVRDRLGIKEGDVLILEEVEGGVLLKKGRDLFDLVGIVKLDSDVSLDKLIEEARERMGHEGG